ncbi:enoyl-CoA hydratase/isomerase family protein [Paracoccus zhejiangensis]|uniref:Enoyl-CoA hydratase n=1 Tax=Paracoccus zhejiangensis TaxID=1077935 RepID=A0A2H5F0P6_9RHOB|nr:enoyl-CoA hydratase/isomerase family protein [Paracoccus zhejiangensis]AUH65120.1 enoyl-CoA hydratase [Paracoccus zhejiangensis]
MISLSQQDGLAMLRIRRPEKANSLTGAMLRQLAEGFDDIAHSDCRAVILTGEGKVFSAGADLDEAQAGLTTSPEWERLSARIATMPCLTIAALNGTLAGGAFGMALACDLRVAVPGASFFYPVMKRGFLPQPSDARRMTTLIGPARAKMILMAGQRIDAALALDWGLVDRIDEDPVAHARDLAADCLAASPELVMAIKGLICQP